MIDLYYIARQFKLLYRIPPGRWLLIAAGFLVLWTLLMTFLLRNVPREQRKNPGVLRRAFRRWKIAAALNRLLLIFGLALILLLTFVRRGYGEKGLVLLPLRPLFGVKTPGDYWQVMIMNIVLYVPFACGLTFRLRERVWHPFWVALLICFLMSVLAEALQYVFGSGLCEVDDVLMNMLGALFGALPSVICRRLGSEGF